MDFPNVPPSLPGGWVALASLIGAAATFGAVLSLPAAATAAITPDAPRNEFLTRLTWFVALTTAAFLAWFIADALADPENPFATLFLKLRTVAYVVAGGGAAYTIVRPHL